VISKNWIDLFYANADGVVFVVALCQVKCGTHLHMKLFPRGRALDLVNSFGCYMHELLIGGGSRFEFEADRLVILEIYD
jgi:hypothetical protein